MTSSICSRMAGSISLRPLKMAVSRAMNPARLAVSPARMPAISRLLTRGREAAGGSEGAVASPGDGTDSSAASTSADFSSAGCLLAGTSLGLATCSTPGEPAAEGGFDVPPLASSLGFSFDSSVPFAASSPPGESAFGLRRTKNPMTARMHDPEDDEESLVHRVVGSGSWRWLRR